MIVIITGTPGTGKTSVARSVGKKLWVPVVNDGELAKRKYVGMRSFRMRVYNLIRKRKDLILEGHLFCEVKLPADHVFVLRTRPDVLASRLRERGYPWKKIWENVLAEALDYCTIKAEYKYGTINQVDTTGRSIEETANIIINTLKSGGRIYEHVDWSPILEQLLLNKRKDLFV